MVVGQSNLGKTTLIESLFGLSTGFWPPTASRFLNRKAIRSSTIFSQTNGIDSMITVLDTPGFGNKVNNTNCWEPIVNFIETEFNKYALAERRVGPKVIDNRVHCCLYLIAPTGHGLKPLDVEFMQRICDKVNIIPIIAKVDTMTPREIQLFKEQVRMKSDNSHFFNLRIVLLGYIDPTVFTIQLIRDK